MVKRLKELPKWFFKLLLAVACGYLVVNVIQCQLNISDKQQELETLKAQVSEQKAENDELRRSLSDGEDAIIERMAREQGFARPNERVFYDVSGK